MFKKLSGYVQLYYKSCKLVENSASQDPSIIFEIIFPGMHVSRPSD